MHTAGGSIVASREDLHQRPGRHCRHSVRAKRPAVGAPPDADSRAAVDQARGRFLRTWRLRCRPVIACLDEAGEDLFTVCASHPRNGRRCARRMRWSGSTRNSVGGRRRRRVYLGKTRSSSCSSACCERPVRPQQSGDRRREQARATREPRCSNDEAGYTTHPISVIATIVMFPLIAGRSPYTPVRQLVRAHPAHGHDLARQSRGDGPPTEQPRPEAPAPAFEEPSDDWARLVETLPCRHTRSADMRGCPRNPDRAGRTRASAWHAAATLRSSAPASPSSRTVSQFHPALRRSSAASIGKFSSSFARMRGFYAGSGRTRSCARSAA